MATIPASPLTPPNAGPTGRAPAVAGPDDMMQRLKGLNPEALRKAASEFEGVFLSQMLAPMFEGIATDGPFGGGHAEEVYRSLMIDEFGKQIARAGGVGIADQVVSQILQSQEVK